MWDLIVSVLDHCLSFYFARYTSQGNRAIIARKRPLGLQKSGKYSYFPGRREILGIPGKY